MKLAKKYIFKGLVQGVGFRVTVTACAHNLKVYGYVKNLASGHVEVHAEGEKQEIDKLIKKITKRMEKNITLVVCQDTQENGYDNFSIH